MKVYSKDGLIDGLSQLNPVEQAIAKELLTYASTSWNPTKERCKAAIQVFRTIGAKQIKDTGNLRRSTYLWELPCGCIYRLNFGNPIVLSECKDHPGEPLTRDDAKGIAENLLHAFIGFLLVSTIVCGAGVLLWIFTGESNNLKIVTLFCCAIALGVYLLIRKRNTKHSAK